MAAGHDRGPPWSWLHDPLIPFVLDAVAGVLTGLVWRTRGVGAGAVVLVMGALVVALYARVVTLWELRGGVRDSPSRIR